MTWTPLDAVLRYVRQFKSTVSRNVTSACSLARKGTEAPLDHGRTSKACRYQETSQYSSSTQLARDRPTPHQRISPSLAMRTQGTLTAVSYDGCSVLMQKFHVAYKVFFCVFRLNITHCTGRSTVYANKVYKLYVVCLSLHHWQVIVPSTQG